MCPITISAKKALRQSKKRTVKNIQNKTAIKKLLKEIKKLASEKKNEEAKKLLPQIYKLLDKAAKTGLIKGNTVARKKSRIARSINKSQQ
jgi:small subunit ribosomal protein S20